MPGRAATFAICFTPGRNPPTPIEKEEERKMTHWSIWVVTVRIISHTLPQ